MKTPFFVPLQRIIDDFSLEVIYAPKDIGSIQADEKNPNDCAKEPHDVTHSVDMCRYFAIMRVRAAEKKKAKKRVDPFAMFFEEPEVGEDAYQDFLCGGEITDNYMM